MASSYNFNCSVCHATFLESDTIFSTFCGHIYHEYCLKRALSVRPACPICNSPSRPRQARRIFFSTFPFEDKDLLEARQAIERLEKQNFELRIQNVILSCESESKIWLSSKVLLVEIAENHLETLKSELSEDERRLVDLGLEELKKGQENLEMEEGEMDEASKEMVWNNAF
ncbi:hypothetical protein L596_013624 [Steinernema carpocapsae]|uniref:RING-type domain-containing protein n=1 Tax=Steinernema carpocapsae TaxID=34508 RepID=A0A4U5P0Q6_STECR|nr:hypothetical protein L596_013624 [Steinernema carpocapsae]